MVLGVTLLALFFFLPALGELNHLGIRRHADVRRGLLPPDRLWRVLVSLGSLEVALQFLGALRVELGPAWRVLPF